MKMIVLHPSALNQKILRHPSFLYIKLESESYSVVSDSLQLYSPWNSPGQNTRVASLSLLQEIFPTQGSNSGLLHCRQIVYQLSHKGSPFHMPDCFKHLSDLPKARKNTLIVKGSAQDNMGIVDIFESGSFSQRVVK